MTKLRLLSTLLCSIVLIAGQALAISLSLDPSAQTILAGDTASVDLNIADLSAFTPPSLGAFDLDITFDDSVLSFDSVMFGTLLGDEGLGEAITGVDPSTAGVVGLEEVSLLFDFELDALQPSSFTLATLTFTGNSMGSSSLDLDNVVLSDAFGTVLPNPTLEGASVIVEAATIPEPSTFLLLGTSLVTLLCYNWRRRRKQHA